MSSTVTQGGPEKSTKPEQEQQWDKGSDQIRDKGGTGVARGERGMRVCRCDSAEYIEDAAAWAKIGRWRWTTAKSGAVFSH